MDGTSTPKGDLTLCSWDGATWVPTGASQVDLVSDVVRGTTPHFTLFAPLREAPTADSVAPAEVEGLKITRAGRALTFTWNPVMLDIGGGAESVHHYNLYRGTSPAFTPDRVAHANLVGTSTTATFFQAEGVDTQPDYYYLVTAVDRGYNEGN